MTQEKKEKEKEKEKEKKPPLIERTDNRGLFELTFPWVGGKVDVTLPATNRSIMIVLVVGIVSLAFMVPSTCYIIFAQARVENVETFSSLFRDRDDKDDITTPTKIPVKTDDGIEVIEVCPPCPVCEEVFEPCICPTCPACPPFKVEPLTDAGQDSD